MNQLIYLLLIFSVSFTLAMIYFLCLKMYKVVKIVITLVSILTLTCVCYMYNYFVFNEYVVLTILYAIYFAYIVKIHVKKFVNKPHQFK